MPPSMPPMIFCDSASTFLCASLKAAMTMSCKHLDVAGRFGVDLHGRARSSGRPSSR